MSGKENKGEEKGGETGEAPLGKRFDNITLDDLHHAGQRYAKTAVIGDCVTVTSFNWLDGCLHPTIAVPGKPRKWTPPPDDDSSDYLPRATDESEDTGSISRDPNTACYPHRPMEPTVMASLAVDPCLGARSDILACDGALGDLLRFAMGAAAGDGNGNRAKASGQHFRILAELVDNTLFLVRREPSMEKRTDKLHVPDGYGQAFKDRYTAWEPDVAASTSYQRLIGYAFGGLNLLVRFEADGYFTPGGESSEAEEHVQRKSPPRDQFGEPMPTRQPESTFIRPHAADGSVAPVLELVDAGAPIRQDRIFALKRTHGARSETQEADVLPAVNTLLRPGTANLPWFWLTRVEHLMDPAPSSTAPYGSLERRGPAMRSLEPEVRRWAADNRKGALARFAALLHRLKATAARGRFEICCGGDGGKGEPRPWVPRGLRLREQMPDVGEGPLSPEVKARWMQPLVQL